MKTCFSIVLLSSFFLFQPIWSQILFKPRLNIGCQVTLGWAQNKIIENTAPKTFEAVKTTPFGNFVLVSPINANQFFFDLQLFTYNSFFLGLGFNYDHAVTTSNVFYNYTYPNNPNQQIRHSVHSEKSGSDNEQLGVSLGFDYVRNPKRINRFSMYHAVIHEFTNNTAFSDIYDFEEGIVITESYDPNQPSNSYDDKVKTSRNLSYSIRLRYDLMFKTKKRNQPKFGFFFAAQTGFETTHVTNTKIQMLGTNKRILINSRSTSKCLVGGIYYTINFYKK